ncbi:MAG: hypothetical protein AAFU64_20590, partial [Bacteroidota bacterium]
RLQIRVFSEVDGQFRQMYDEKNISFQLGGKQQNPKNFSLIHVPSNLFLQAIQDGDRIYLDPERLPLLNIKASFPGESENIASTRMILEGPIQRLQTENVLPYALFGNAPNDPNEYQGALFPEGQYTLSAIPFFQKGAQEPAGDTIRVNFEVLHQGAPQPQVQSVFLLDAHSGQPLRRIQDGDTIQLEPDAQRLYTLQALTAPAQIGSIRFELDGPVSWQQNENLLPYTLFGEDNTNGFSLNGQSLKAGNYRLKLLPFSEARLNGQAGSVQEISFRIEIPSTNITISQFAFWAQGANSGQPLGNGDSLMAPLFGDIEMISQPIKIGSVVYTISSPNYNFQNIENV